MNTSNWTNRELRVFYYMTMFLYFALTILAPAFVIIWKYKLFQKGGGLELNGGLLIVIIAVAVIGLRKFKAVINKYDAETIKEKRFKYTMLGIYAIAYPVIALLVLWALKDNFKLGFSVCKYCAIFYFISVILDYGFFKYLEDERHLRKESQHKAEVQKREKYNV